jgi:hypothetical protein
MFLRKKHTCRDIKSFSNIVVAENLKETNAQLRGDSHHDKEPIMCYPLYQKTFVAPSENKMK